MISLTNSGKPPQGVAENTRRTTVNSTMMTVPGSRAVNWADTALGTESGSLMVKFFCTRKR